MENNAVKKDLIVFNNNHIGVFEMEEFGYLVKYNPVEVIKIGKVESSKICGYNDWRDAKSRLNDIYEFYRQGIAKINDIEITIDNKKINVLDYCKAKKLYDENRELF